MVGRPLRDRDGALDALRRRASIRAALAALVALGLLGAGSARAQLAPEGALPLGAWCGPSGTALADDAAADARMAEMAAAGLNLVMGPCDALWDKATTRRVLRAAQAHGLRVIVQDPRITAAVSTGRTARLAGVIADYGSYPALGGWFVLDEPVPVQFAEVGAVVDWFRARDPGHPAYVNALPQDGAQPPITYARYLDGYLDTIAPPLLSYDHYSLPDFFQNLVTVRDAAAARGIPFWQIVLATGHNAYPQPTAAQKLWEGMQTLAYGAKGVLYFTYWTVPSPAFGESAIGLDGTPTAQYAELQAVTGRLQTVGRALLPARSRYTFQTGLPAPGAIARPPGAPVQIAGSAPLTVGVFAEPGMLYTLVANNDAVNPVSAPVQLSHGIALPERQAADGTWLPIVPTVDAGGQATVGVTLPPGDAALFRTAQPVTPYAEVVAGRATAIDGRWLCVE